ncbi:CHAD domain-containing protein [Ramlibacter sp. XY19]|uniref:CYTH and CHAD domain-containing protein n=1 Tax=Ramlibacter paludis TaxID=2908000 RepID=UPI0023D9E6D7|nr:CYTH and CHAD domain-containing protein [Ramlibacter paludis]MCG2595008.1 CHAD domain-containing protein [Ramlibacter paludis]
MHEFELKFQVPTERLAGVEAALRRGKVESTQLRARYYDTPAEDLARNRLVLRVRQEGPYWVQAAKGPGRGGLERLEDEVPSAGGEEIPVPERHRWHPVGKLLRKALRHSAGALDVVFETDVTRLTRVVEAGGSSIEIALDRGHVRAGRRSHAIQEVEFELKQGSAAALAELADGWMREHGLWLDPVSKAEQGRRLGQGADAAPAVLAKARAGEVESPAQLLAGILGAGLDQVLGNARELAAGGGSDEHVHQLRIGLRRLRTALRELRGIAGLDGIASQIEPAIRDLFQLLGQHRDRATLVPAVEQDLARIGAPPMHDWQPRLPDVAAAIRDPGFQSALLQLIVLVQDLHEAPPGKLKGTRKMVSRRLDKLHHEVLHDGRRFETLALDDRHRVRKRLKRLRYLAELARPLFAGRVVDRYVETLKALQDALGEYQDAASARTLFERHAEKDAKAWFGAGWLAAREGEIAARCEQACRKAARLAKPFF